MILGCSNLETIVDKTFLPVASQLEPQQYFSYYCPTINTFYTSLCIK